MKIFHGHNHQDVNCQLKNQVQEIPALIEGAWGGPPVLKIIPSVGPQKPGPFSHLALAKRAISPLVSTPFLLLHFYWNMNANSGGRAAKGPTDLLGELNQEPGFIQQGCCELCLWLLRVTESWSCSSGRLHQWSRPQSLSSTCCSGTQHSPQSKALWRPRDAG